MDRRLRPPPPRPRLWRWRCTRQRRRARSTKEPHGRRPINGCAGAPWPARVSRHGSFTFSHRHPFTPPRSTAHSLSAPAPKRGRLGREEHQHAHAPLPPQSLPSPTTSAPRPTQPHPPNAANPAVRAAMATAGTRGPRQRLLAAGGYVHRAAGGRPPSRNNPPWSRLPSRRHGRPRCATNAARLRGAKTGRSRPVEVEGGGRGGQKPGEAALAVMAAATPTQQRRLQ